MENREKSRKKCEALLRSLREKHLAPLIRELSPETKFGEIKVAFDDLLDSYDEQSIGPAADEVLKEFIKVLDQICNIRTP